MVRYLGEVRTKKNDGYMVTSQKNLRCSSQTWAGLKKTRTRRRKKEKGIEGKAKKEKKEGKEEKGGRKKKRDMVANRKNP